MLAEFPLTDQELAKLSGLPVDVVRRQVACGKLSCSVGHPYRGDDSLSRPNPYDLARSMAEDLGSDKDALCDQLDLGLEQLGQESLTFDQLLNVWRATVSAPVFVLPKAVAA